MSAALIPTAGPFCRAGLGLETGFAISSPTGLTARATDGFVRGLSKATEAGGCSAFVVVSTGA